MQLVVLGQSADVFARGGYPNVFEWQEVTAAARRRRCFFNGKDTLACFIASRSDIDDIIPVLTAYQIEWNKLHQRLQRLPSSVSLAKMCADQTSFSRLADLLEVSEEDIDRLYAIWDEDLGSYMEQIASEERNLRVLLLSGSLSEYRRATHAWWNNIERASPGLNERPVYFISSNTHSFVNTLTGFALQHQDELVHYLNEPGNAGLLNEWNDIQAQQVPSSGENFLYYVMRKYLQSPGGQALERKQRSEDVEMGVIRSP